MSIRALLQLVDGHASGALSDHELSQRLHSLDGKGARACNAANRDMCMRAGISRARSHD
jgi:hypothetical protein